MSILDAWLGPKSTSAGGYNTALKILMELYRSISPWQEIKIILINYIHLNFRPDDCLSISRPL